MSKLYIDTKNKGDKVTHTEFNEIVSSIQDLQGNEVENLPEVIKEINRKIAEGTGTGGSGGTGSGLVIGTTAGTAYDGGKGTALEARTQVLEGKAQALDTTVQNLGTDSQSQALRIEELEGNRLVIGTEEGTAFDGAAGALLEQMLRELAGGGGTMYSVYMKNNMSSLGFASQYGESCVLDFSFVSQYRDSLDEPYKPTGELGICTVMVRNSRYTDYTIVKQMEISSGVSVKLDVAEWLSSGSNSVKITVAGENTDKTTSAVTYTVALTSLGVSAPNFQWWTAFAGDISVPMMVNGNISKILHVTVTGKDYIQSYEQNLGTAIYTDTPYNYVIPHPAATGIYNVSFYLSNTDNTIQTKTVSVNVMCIGAAGEDVKLMCVNNVADQLTNWQENKVWEYSVYDGQATSTDVLLSVRKGNDTIYESDNATVTTSSRQSFTYPMEVETDDDSNFEVSISAASNGAQLTDTVTLPVNNSLGFSAIAGAVFYLNPRTRSNSQANRMSVVNEVDKSVVGVTWTGLNWSNDGWVADADGNKALKIFAGSRAVIDYRPFATEAARKGKTIEIDYRVDNAADASQDIMTIAEGDTGLRVSGGNISFFSQSRKDSTTQDVPTDNGVRIRLVVTVVPDAYGTAGFNLVCIYVNGKKNRQYAYENNDYFRQDGQIVLGNENANLYIYGLRIYDKALTSEAAQKNYINQLSTTQEKEAERSANGVLDAEGTNIDYLNTKAKYNTFVFDQPFPNLLNPGGVGGTLQVSFVSHPEWDFSVNNVLAEGQGTSSKKYWEWNIRWKLKALKDAQGNKIASMVTYADGTSDKNQARIFPGVPKAAKITAKKNWASSMQDHKAGSVAAYTDLYKSMGMTNEGISADSTARVSVYQEPFIGFSKSVNEEGQDVYTCMGEFTLGPDKGDANCFGYDTSAFPELLSVEGSDNAPLGALFRVPWDRSKQYWKYNADEEAFQYNNTNSWDFDAGELNADGTEPLSTQKWVDTYNAVYVCSNRIKPFNGTLAELNAAVADYRSTGYEYWIAKAGDANLYNLYYYEAAEGKFIPSDTGGGQINLQTQLKAYLNSDLSSFNAGQLNEQFINARIRLFRDTAPAYWDIKDSAFQYCFVEYSAGTDQRAKNTYPYSFCTGTSKWKWRIDDADTIFPIDNQGQDRKPYWCEMHDFYANGQPMWNGETSVFWNLIELSYADEIATAMKNMLAAMEALSGQTSGTPYDKVYAFYKKYYLGVKNYFPATLVNADAKRYEMAKVAYNSGLYTNDTDPITQSHGDFFSAETAWVKKRIMYIMSKYNYGLFSANGTDTVIVRAAGDLINYELTPAFDMYPAIANGTSIVGGARTKAGEVCRMTIDLGGSADQQNAIQAASWLLSIGDWHDKNVGGTMVVRGRRLTELTLGSKTEPVTISITGLTISDCGSMRKVLLSNIASLQGTLDVSVLENLREIHADGTGLTQLKLPEGGGLEIVEYPAGNRYLTLRNFPVLTADGLYIDQCAPNVSDFLVENCPKLSPMRILTDIMSAQPVTGHALEHIRAVGFNETFDHAMLDRLAQLADGTYSGLSADGVAGEDPYPVLDGTLTINSNYYEDSVESLRNTFGRLVLNLNGVPYIRFADKTAQSIVVSNWGDGVGITKEQAAAVQSLGDKFRGNSEITEFDEFQFFTGFPERGDGSVLFGDTGDNGSNCFRGMANLRHFIIPRGMTNLSPYAVYDCPLLEWFELPSTLTSVYWGASITIGSLPNLQYIICKAVAPINRGNLPVGNSTWKLLVPYGSVEAYRNDERWSSMASRIQPILVHELASITATYNDATGRVEVTYDPVHTAYRDVTYTVISGAQYATIDSNGKVRPLEGADNSPVTIEVSSVHDPSVKSSVDIQVTYTGVVLYDCMTTDGASYIKTGIIPANDMRVEAKAYITATNNALFGSRAATSSKAFGVQFIDSSKIRAEVGTAQKEAVSYSQDTDYEMSLTPSEFVVNGVSYATGVSTIGGAAYEMYLGSLNTAGLAHTGQWNGGIYYFRVYKSDVLVMDLRPAEVGGIICFHDMVSGDNYYNAGTGKMSVR